MSPQPSILLKILFLHHIKYLLRFTVLRQITPYCWPCGSLVNMLYCICQGLKNKLDSNIHLGHRLFWELSSTCHSEIHLSLGNSKVHFAPFKNVSVCQYFTSLSCFKVYVLLVNLFEVVCHTFIHILRQEEGCWAQCAFARTPDPNMTFMFFKEKL